MDTMLLFLVILLLLLLAVFGIAAAILAYKYFSLKAQVDVRVQEGLERWQATEREQIRVQQAEIARREASVQLQQWKEQQELLIRQDAVQRSQAVTLGKITEHFIPYLPEFAYNPKDARFIGSPIDFLVFDGLSEGEVKSIVFIEVKTGSSALSTRERRIRDAIHSGRVQWLELRHHRE